MLEKIEIYLRRYPELRSFAAWRLLKRMYMFGLKFFSLNRGLKRELYPGVLFRVSYASRHTMEADFGVTSKWDVPCLDLIRRWTADNQHACFFDVGANHGQFALVVSRWLDPETKRVFAFEPHPDNCRVLQENLRRAASRNVEVVGVALADRIGNMTLHGESVTASLQANVAGGQGTEHIVQVETMDAFCTRMGCMPDVIKIDVEGFELDVLRGAVATLNRQQSSIKIICEMHTFMWSEPDYDLRLIEVVESCGLKVFKLDGTPVPRILDYGHYVLAKTYG